MPVDLNTSPYFDDFDPLKGYNRILFKPGVAVQARELTQVQTILQDQLQNLASWQFREGAVISGCAQNTFNIPYIKLEGQVAIDNLSNYIGDIIVGQSTGIRARIIAVVTGGGTNPEPNLNTFYLEYIDMGGETNNNFSTITLGLTDALTHFYRGEVLTVEATNFAGEASDNEGDAFEVNDYGSSDETYYGNARKMFVSPGIIYARGHFIRTEEISAILSRYGPGSTKRVIGFNVQETIVQSPEDNTLLDPASGSYNYNAPGADRLKFEVTLSVYDANSSDIPENFFQYAILDEDNQIEYAEVIVDDLNELRKIIARRTYEESGHYSLGGLAVSLQEHLNDGENGGRYYAASDTDNYVPGTVAGDETKMIIEVDSGKAYVKGNEIQLNVPAIVTVDKATDTLNDQAVDVTMSVGNYIRGHTLTGDMLSNDFTKVVLRSTGKSGPVIGTARIKHLKLDTGGAGPYLAGITNAQGTATDIFYRMYLYDVQITGNIADCAAITKEGSADDGMLVNAADRKFVESKFAKSVWKAPYEYLKHVGDLSGNNSQCDIEYVINGTAILGTNPGGTSTVSFTTPNGEVFETSYSDDQIRNDLILIAQGAVTVDVAGTPEGYSANDIVDLTNNDVSITTTAGGTQLNITFTNCTVGGTVKLYANVRKDNATPIQKSIAEHQVVVIDTDTNATGTTGPWTLGVTDVYRLRSIRAYRDDGSGGVDVASELDVTPEFNFNNGQRDSIYKLATIAMASSSTLVLSSTGYRYLAVEFDYFTHGSSNYSFFTVESYPENSVLPLQWIPVYRTAGGQEISLRDAIDFRPSVDNTATPTTVSTTVAAAADAALTAGTENPVYNEQFSGTNTPQLTFPVPDSVFTAGFEWYVPKAIKIYMNDSGRIKTLENSGAVGTVPPITPEGTMELGSVYMAPFPSLTAENTTLTGRKDLATRLTTVDNRRYTMKDLRAIDQRISNLEYYVTLNALEKEAESMLIPDGSGLDRFKNGILVDDFTGYSVGRSSSPEFKASIDDKDSQTANPSYRKDNIILDYDPTGSTVKKWGTSNAEGFVSAPYTSVEYIQQVQKSKTRNCVGELLFDYVGKMKLSPSIDNWVDNVKKKNDPVVDSSKYDEKTNGIVDGETVWGDWETTNVEVKVDRKNQWGWWFVGGRWVRRKITTTTTTTEEQERTGTKYKINEVVDKDTKYDVNIQFAVYIRSRGIFVSVNHMKPNTPCYFFFDGVDVDASMSNVGYGTTSGYGSSRKHFTDSKGRWQGRFVIPAGKFRVGTRTLKMTDDRLNRKEFETTYCSAQYTSSGLKSTVTSTEYITRDAVVQTETVTDQRDKVTTKTEIRYAHDPLAQSFRIEDAQEGADNGVFITSVDLWFRTKPSSGDQGITLQIRNMENGYPGPIVLGEKYLARTSIVTTPENSAGVFSFNGYHTRFTFDAPVYLQHGFEYCIVPMPEQNNRDYNMWVAELGEFETNSTQRISEQPHSGILFTSANNTTWSAIQNEDMMFRIHRAKFTVGTHVANFVVSNTDYLRLEKIATDDPNGTFWENHDTFPPFPRQTSATDISDIDPFFGSPDEGYVYSIAVDIGGTSTGGYADTDTLTPSGGGGTGAQFELITYSGNPIAVKCIDPGIGYTSAPTLTYAGSGSGATFTARYNKATPLVTYAAPGRVGGLARSYGVFDVLEGYFTQNRIRIPTVTGSFQEGEMIQGATSNVTARIVNKDPDGYYRLASVSGKWTIGETINGLYSSASGAMATDFVEYSDVLKNYPQAGDPVFGYHRTAQIASIDDRPYHELATNMSTQLIPSDTEVEVFAYTTPMNSSGPNVTLIDKMTINQLRPFEQKKNVLSYSNRIRKGATNGWNTTPDLKIVTNLVVFNEFVSPIVDLQSMDAMVLLNVFNDDSTNETLPGGGNAKAKYVSKTVVLAEGQDAEDLNVFLSAYDPPGTTLEAYGKFLSADDQTEFDDANWLQLDLVDEPLEKVTGVLREYKYQIPRFAFSGTDSEEGYDTGNNVYRKTVGVLTDVTVGGTTDADQVDLEIAVSGGSGTGARVLVDTDSSGNPTNVRVMSGGAGYSTTDTLTYTYNGTAGLTFSGTTIVLADYRSYKRYALKFVMLAPEDGVYFPNLHDYRAIALQS